MARYRERKYEAREPVVGKPGEAYGWFPPPRRESVFKDLPEAVLKPNSRVKPPTPTLYYTKAPPPREQPVVTFYDDGLCEHQVAGYCVFCDMR